MSVIRKLPYIEALLASMTAANLKDLRTVLNTGGSNVNLDFEHLNAATYKNKVTPVYFKFEDNGLKTGILIWTNSMCALICYHRFQDLIIFELSPTYHTSKKINEYCDINELRRVLDDTVESTGAIDSGSAAAGALPFADGNGGVGWDKPVDYIKGDDFPDGSTSVKMIAIDDDGDLVKVDIPEGTVVVDSALSDSSENPVQNKVITENIYTKTDVDALLETKANVDGNYPTMTVGAADNLTPYDESAGDDQDDPFLFQATGTGNGSQADFATGSLALMKEKRGNSVVVNQYVANDKKTYTNVSTDSKTSLNFMIQVLASGQFQGSAILNRIIESAGFYNFLITIPANINGDTLKIKHNGSLTDLVFADVSMPVIENHNILVSINLTGVNPSVAGGLTANDFNVVNFTQWFGSNDNIPADLLAHPENFFRYYQGSLAYNAGQIVNANSRYIKCIGRQQWDEEWEVGGISADNGANVVELRIRSKNYIRVIPNQKYYFYMGATANGRVFFYDKDKNFIAPGSWGVNTTFTTPSNCCFMRFTGNDTYGTTYNNDITISLYYEGESGYNKYYPYEVLTNNDTGTEELKSAGSVADSKTPDGVITRRVGSVDLGTLTWGYDSTNQFFYTDEISSLRKRDVGKLLCAKYTYYDSINIIIDSDMLNAPNNCITTNGEYGVYIYVKNTSYTDAATFKTAMNGVMLQYELAEPTTEQGTPFSENLVIDDFGSMEFAGTSGVPQGNLIFYPVDYKAFVDTLYDYTEGTPSDIALKSDLTVVDNKIGAKIPECPTDTDGTYVLKATVSDGVVTYTWVLEE